MHETGFEPVDALILSPVRLPVSPLVLIIGALGLEPRYSESKSDVLTSWTTLQHYRLFSFNPSNITW